MSKCNCVGVAYSNGAVSKTEEKPPFPAGNRMPILEKGLENDRNIFSTSLCLWFKLRTCHKHVKRFYINIKSFLLNGSQCPPTFAFDSGFDGNLCTLRPLSVQLSHFFPRATTGGLVLGTVLPKSFTLKVAP